MFKLKKASIFLDSRLQKRLRGDAQVGESKALQAAQSFAGDLVRGLLADQDSQSASHLSHIEYGRLADPYSVEVNACKATSVKRLASKPPCICGQGERGYRKGDFRHR